MDPKVTVDLTPIFSELFKVQASIDALAEAVLNDEQKETFKVSYLNCLKRVIKEFTEDFPNIITDKDALLQSLDNK